jgi:hypothetical protein
MTNALDGLFSDYDDASAAKDVELAKKPSQFISKLPVGKTVMRFLPPAPGKKSPFRVYYQHFVKGIPGVADCVFVCPRMEMKRPCPLCTLKARWEASDDSTKINAAKDLEPRSTTSALVIVRGEEEQGVRVFRMSYSVHQALLEIRNELDMNFSHPIDGCDIVISRKGTGPTDTRYRVIPDPRGKSPLASSEAEMAELLGSMPNLDSFVKVHDAPTIEGMLRGEKPQNRQLGGGGGAQQLPGKRASSYLNDE